MAVVFWGIQMDRSGHGQRPAPTSVVPYYTRECPMGACSHQRAVLPDAVTHRIHTHAHPAQLALPYPGAVPMTYPLMFTWTPGAAPMTP